MTPFKVLPQEFYARDPATVAEELLGKRLVRTIEGTWLAGIVVETEAYYGLTDPASRAYHGVKAYNQLMWKEPGRAFIYNVHKYWMFNIVAHPPNHIGAVLIRALEPTKGIAVMQRNRPARTVSDLTNGPGKLTMALAIDKRLNGTPVTVSGSTIIIADHTMDLDIGRSHRIGVKRDLERKLRFYVKGNECVSR